MRVCVLGTGAREHALAWAADAFGHDVVVVPGNPGIPWSTPEEPTDADLYILGSEAVVCAGHGDRLRANGHRVFGPGADGGQLEGSKRWMKHLLAEAGIPTARHLSCDTVADATAFLRELPGGYVVKTDYLALGKGVLVTNDIDEAIEDARDKLQHGSVVIEERLQGVEFSVLAVCDGRRAVPLPLAMDHKRLLDGDQGPNTGGMGVVSPVPRLEASTLEQAMTTCVEPTLAALRDRGIDYRGMLYGGPLMLTSDGVRVVEWNVRWGDPEAQALLPLFESDPCALMAEAADGALESTPRFTGRSAVSVSLASAGYPLTSESGVPIEGLAAAQQLPDVELFSAAIGPDNTTNGGRVVSVTGIGDDIHAARKTAYEAVDHITWPGRQYRTDIGLTALG